MLARLRLTKLSIILSVIVIVLLGYVFIMRPALREWNDLEQRIENLNVQYMRSSKTIGHFQEALRRYREYELTIKQTKSDEEEVASFLKEIESFMVNLNISINDIKPLPDEKRDKAHILFIDVELEASIQDVTALLHNIASSQTMITVERMSMAMTKPRQGLMTIQFVFSKTFLS